MALDKILIGNRIRKVREELFEESRKEFAQRCNLSERHIGQIERGDFLISLHSLDMIVSNTGIDVDFILYGKNNNNKLEIKEILENIISKADKNDLKIYYKLISIVSSYTHKKRA